MKVLRHIMKFHNCRVDPGERGIAALELALILPVMLIIVFAIVDFGRLFNARLEITNIAREGGSLACRDMKSAADIITMLQTGASDLDLAKSGKIYVWKINGGSTQNAPYPYIDTASSANAGLLSVQSSIGSNVTNLGFSNTFYQHLVYNTTNKMSDVTSVTVVEVFYKYTPISPISKFIPGLITSDSGGKIISSKAVF
jgi:Flp pilus assembly protein TadG